MNTIYLDTLFLVNCITDYLTLLCTAIVSGAAIRRTPIAFASVIGGCYACLCTFPLWTWASAPLVKLALAVMLCLISFGREQRLLRCCLIFFLVSAIFGGILSAFLITLEETTYLTINWKVLLVTFAATYCFLTVLYRRAPRPNSQQYRTATISLRGKTLRFTVLNDTGNQLYDPISNLPVLICEKPLLADLLPELFTIPSVDLYDQFCQLNSIPSLAGRFRILSFQSISEQGILLGFRPDEIFLDGHPTERIVAFSEKQLSTSNSYQGIC